MDYLLLGRQEFTRHGVIVSEAELSGLRERRCQKQAKDSSREKFVHNPSPVRVAKGEINVREKSKPR